MPFVAQTAVGGHLLIHSRGSHRVLVWVHWVEPWAWDARSATAHWYNGGRPTPTQIELETYPPRFIEYMAIKNVAHGGFAIH